MVSARVEFKSSRLRSWSKYATSRRVPRRTLPERGCNSHFQQRRLAAAVGPDQADLVAAQDRRAELAHEPFCVVKAHAHAAQFGDDFSARHTRIDLEAHLAERLAPRHALGAQGLQALHPAHTSRAPCLDALAHPHLLLGEQFVGAVAREQLGGELVFLDTLIGAEVARVAAQRAAIQLDDSRDHVVQKIAVVGDEHHGAAKVAQQTFEPGDRVQVQVVRRLIQQQHVRNRDQRLRQGDALFHAAAELTHLALAIELQVRQRRFDALLPVPRVERFDSGVQGIERRVVRLRVRRGLQRCVRFVGGAHRARFGHAFADGVEDGRVAVKHGFLRDVADAQSLRQLQQTVVELVESGDDFQERRLARTVAPDEAEPLTRFERKGGVVEQRDMPEGETRVGKGKDGHVSIVSCAARSSRLPPSAARIRACGRQVATLRSGPGESHCIDGSALRPRPPRAPRLR
jgi:hypothetical protein